MIYLGNNEFIKGYINNLNKVYIGNDLLYWNAKEDNNTPTGDTFITLTSDTSKSIPMQTFRIDMTDPNNTGYYFVRFSTTPNDTGAPNNMLYSIAIDENLIFDNGSRKYIDDQLLIGDNIYEYTFSTIVYIHDIEKNAPISQIQYKQI